MTIVKLLFTALILLLVLSTLDDMSVPRWVARTIIIAESCTFICAIALLVALVWTA